MNIACKLTSQALRDRKNTTIKSLRDKVKSRLETESGFTLQFVSTDTMLAELVDFIKLERLCCDFFTFNLRIEGDHTWLTLEGPDGTKEFIEQELQF